MVGLSSRCGCVTSSSSSTHGDVVRNRNKKDPPEPDAILEGLAMAGFVAILRQLGDLAELAVEVFDDMQDQVMAASARGRRLAVRAKRLLEGVDSAAALTIATSSSSGRVASRFGQGGTPTPPPISMPRLVVQRIKRCRGPPRLSLLDKFDAAGEGACLKRYTDPSFFFRAHSACRLQQGTLRLSRANRGAPHLLKSMSMQTRPKFQTALNSEPPESAHTDSKSKTDASESEAPSPGFLFMLRQLKQNRHRHLQEAGDASPFPMQQTVDRVQSSPQLNMEHKHSTTQPSPSPSELERTSSFEAWLSPDACRFTTAATHHHEHDEIITQEQEPPHPHGAATTTNCSGGSVSHDVTITSNADAALSSSTMLKANKFKGASNNKSSWRYKGSAEMIASRASSLPRKFFSNIKHHNSNPAGTSLRISQATGILGDCSPELEAITTPILLPSNPVCSSIHNLLPLPENENYYSYLQQHQHETIGDSIDADRHHQQEHPSSTEQCSNSNSSTPETIGDSTCTPPDSKNLLCPARLFLKRAGALPENSSSQDAKVDTAPPLPPIPPMQWLSERTRPASPRHRALWKKSLEVTEMIKAIRQAHSQSIQTSTLVSNENTSANVSHRDEMKCSESEQTRHPQPFRVSEDAVQASSEGIVVKAEINLWTQAQADTCFQQQARQQFCSSGHSDSSSNLQKESVFFSAVQELAKMSPPPSVSTPKYSLHDAGCHGRITLRNGPSLIHPSRNILDSKSVLIKQIKHIAMADNSCFKLKPVSGTGTSSPQSPVTGSPTNSKVATILQRAGDIRKAHADSNDVDSEESWSDDSE